MLPPPTNYHLFLRDFDSTQCNTSNSFAKKAHILRSCSVCLCFPFFGREMTSVFNRPPPPKVTCCQANIPGRQHMFGNLHLTSRVLCPGPKTHYALSRLCPLLLAPDMPVVTEAIGQVKCAEGRTALNSPLDFSPEDRLLRTIPRFRRHRCHKFPGPGS